MKNQVCNRCVMDTTDPEITFNSEGVCNHCIRFDEFSSKKWFPNETGTKKLEEIFEKVKQEGKGKEYDCIIGLSGGIDSSYLALKLKKYELNPLVVHVDAGWNSELAVHNIEKIVKHCGYDLHTHVMEWEEIKDLQLAYLKAGVANQDVVQDHAFFASLYHFAVDNKIKYVISGGNIATESVYPDAWHHAAMDAINLKAIHRKFGSIPLKHYDTIGFLSYFVYYPLIHKMQTIRPLNYMHYSKDEALKYLKEEIGFKDYGRKHGESRFTKFFQNHYLPVKFNMDKRKPHLSSLILSGQMTRNEALKELEKPLYNEQELEDDKIYVAKKLGISLQQLNDLIEAPGKSYKEYKNWDDLYNLVQVAKKVARKLSNKDISGYS